MLATHPDGAAAISENGAIPWKRAAAVAASAASSGADARASVLLAGRTLVNAIRHEPPRHVLAGAPLFAAIAGLRSFQHASVMSVGAALAQNVAHAAALAEESRAGDVDAILGPDARPGFFALLKPHLVGDDAPSLLLAVGTLMLADAAGARGGIQKAKAAGLEAPIDALAKNVGTPSADIAVECLRLLRS